MEESIYSSKGRNRPDLAYSKKMMKMMMSSLVLPKNVKVKTCSTTIVLALLSTYRTWSFTLKEEHSLRVFQKRVVRRIFGHKMGEVMKYRRKLHNEKPYNFTIRVIKWRREG
jgi:hypothetical protein